MRTMCAILLRNQTSIAVQDEISSSVKPRRSASAIASNRSSSPASILRLTSVAESLATLGAANPLRPVSSERSAFCSAASKLRSMAITSPVAFICVPRRRAAPANLSNGHLGTLTTT